MSISRGECVEVLNVDPRRFDHSQLLDIIFHWYLLLLTLHQEMVIHYR